ncbi:MULTISPECIES: ferritin-like domain-containing protein [Streptomyces]|uniref:ferritin-like domain-containing protein n=1 Tax=Streptomyces TaxID=1883 RepID=UPI00031FEB05|nr:MULTISPECIES: ferritin-like domain-containing protein [Streptomyces]
MTDDFVVDVSRIRDEARKKMDEGPVTQTYGSDKDRVIQVLNEVLATEVVCWLRYTRHAIVATGIDRAQVSDEFTEHAKEELNHALMAAERISQLGGDPDFDPQTLQQRTQTDYTAPPDGDLKQMLKDNLLAERIVISTYQEIIRWLSDRDPTSRRVMEKILEEEEDHADDLLDLIGG